MSVSIEQEFSWLVTISNGNSHRGYTSIIGYSPTLFRNVQKSFKTLGFTILELPNEYYNPTIKRFIVKHRKVSAITLWSIQHPNMFKYGVSVEEQFNV